jgi:hypothetical protein
MMTIPIFKLNSMMLGEHADIAIASPSCGDRRQQKRRSVILHTFFAPSFWDAEMVALICANFRKQFLTLKEKHGFFVTIVSHNGRRGDGRNWRGTPRPPTM